MKKSVAIKEYFSDSTRPVTGSEMIEFMKADREGFNEVAKLCAEALG